MEEHADYDGPGLTWGLSFKKASAAQCCQACKEVRWLGLAASRVAACTGPLLLRPAASVVCCRAPRPATARVTRLILLYPSAAVQAGGGRAVLQRVGLVRLAHRRVLVARHL